MNALLRAKVYKSARRAQRNRELDRADTVVLFISFAGIAAVAALGWL